jgi:beta-glucosidase
VATHSFPDGFIWGTATSSQQIEGAHDQDGRGESIWDRFASIPGKIADGSRPDIACDHYHRWREDIEQMKWLGLNAYRFSISWPRILPQGRGAVNATGLDFYDSLVDHLLEAGIEPFPTLYHWDLPQALQDEGGWAERDTVDAFAEYAGVVTRRLGDRVRRWVTHNEPWCIATLGHEEGHHAPGHKDPAEALRVAHHILLSHGRAVPVIRSEVPNAEVGIVNIHCPAYPATDSAGDIDAARWFDGFFNRWFLDPIFRGHYPADVVADRVAAGHLSGSDLLFVESGDLDAISAPLDFLGLNYYSRSVMRTDEQGKRVAVQVAPEEELTDMGWEVFPDGFYNSMTTVQREYGPSKIYITENGAAYNYPTTGAGRVHDSKRIAYLREHLLAVRRAIADGVPVAGYFAWSQMDNFEWGLGYEKKFGLYALDPETLHRIPKDSAHWYRDVVASNAVVDETTSPIQGEPRVHDAKRPL